MDQHWPKSDHRNPQHFPDDFAAAGQNWSRWRPADGQRAMVTVYCPAWWATYWPPERPAGVGGRQKNKPSPQHFAAEDWAEIGPVMGQ